MRIVKAILPLVCTTIIVWLLNKPIGSIPALGKLLDPVSGFWANAECTDKDFNSTFEFVELNDDVSVWFDERLVPHINATNDYDLYFLQGYLHAYFRLFQMDLQTRAASGDVCELLGDKALNYARGQRRKGMVYGAEQSLQKMEANPNTKTALDAYKDGVNKYINSLVFKDYPLEYKLMGFEPSEWKNINTALLLKYMADDLTGKVDDISYSYLRKVLGEEFEFLFPDRINASTPVIPRGTKYDAPTIEQPLVPEGDIWADLQLANTNENIEKGKGSNNWAVAPQRTKNGHAILCNDPHLSLNLPALWFEVQLHTNSVNAYGVSLPGAPGIIIGFNDSLSWGFTNNYRDVKDYYTIKELDNDNYELDGKPMKYQKRVEVIKLKGGKEFVDTVKYTIHGPVMYDANYKEPHGVQQPLAMKWMGHKPSNELLAVYKLNRADNYDEFVDAIGNFTCPAQNFIFSDTKGNIALWGQGQYINKWKDQGRFVMNGATSKTLWGAEIPVRENPHALNPEQGYLSSANQTVTDSTYPYYYNGDFVEFRAWRINKALDSMYYVTVKDLQQLQRDVHSVLAEQVLPTMLSYIKTTEIETHEYIKELNGWDYKMDAGSRSATTFHLWWNTFYKEIWEEGFGFAKEKIVFYPSQERTAELFVGDSVFYQHVQDVLVLSFKNAADSISSLENRAWYKVKNTSINHLTKLAPFSYTSINVGGWGNTVNAMKGNHGPSWRMVVEMADEPQAYGVYPGGQSGNPGSKYYGTFIDKWSKGEYYNLSFISNSSQPKEEQVVFKWKCKK